MLNIMASFLENLGHDVRQRWLDLWERRRARAGGEAEPHLRTWLSPRRVLVAALVVVVLYYPVGMLLYHRIDDDMDLKPDPAFVVPGGSEAVAIVATLVDRETDHWAPNRPFWHPAAALDNMPNFQLGMMYAISRFAVELGDYLGRIRGSSSIDPNLDQAAGLLKYDGRTWYWGQGNIIPTAKAESQYRQAVRALMKYNHDVATGRAIYDRRTDNLISFLDRVAADLGSASAVLDAHAKLGTGYFDRTSDDIFYDVKGKLYGYYMILRAVGDDFNGVIAQKNALPIWNNMLESLREGAEMSPLIVANGRGDSMFVPSHLSALGFHLLRARTQIREISDALEK
jgi:hypothetical protein